SPFPKAACPLSKRRNKDKGLLPWFFLKFGKLFNGALAPPMWYLLAVTGLRDKVVLVTGASGGVVSSRNEEKLQVLVGRLEREVAERWHCALETAKLGGDSQRNLPRLCGHGVDSENARRMADKTGKSIEEVLKLFAESSPQKRLIAPAEVA